MAFLIIPKIQRKASEQIIIDLYAKYGWKNEKKASSASKGQKMEFARAAVGMLQKMTDLKVDCIIVKKENVQAHIRADANKLYNYMCKLVIVDHVAKAAEFDFIPDKRTIKVESGNSLSDYLQTVLWFECNSSATLVNKPMESDKVYNLQFVDWIAHCVRAHYEDGESAAFRELSAQIRIRNLFF